MGKNKKSVSPKSRQGAQHTTAALRLAELSTSSEADAAAGGGGGGGQPSSSSTSSSAIKRQDQKVRRKDQDESTGRSPPSLMIDDASADAAGQTQDAGAMSRTTATSTLALKAANTSSEISTNINHMEERSKSVKPLAPKKHLTKRQKRQLQNNKHAWPQMPKIRSPAARARAYLRVAGLLDTGVDSSVKGHHDDRDDDDVVAGKHVHFGRLLGGTDQRTRHLAVQQLQAYLRAKSKIDPQQGTSGIGGTISGGGGGGGGGLSELDLLKLWKALWYTLYMTDKVPVQDELARRLAALLWCVAGTPEDDEVVAASYLEWTQQQEDEAAAMEDHYGNDEEEGEQGDDEEDDSEQEGNHDDEDPEVIMEEIANTLNDDDEDEEEESDNDDSEQSGDEQSMDVDPCGLVAEQADMEGEDIPVDQVPHCRGAHLAALMVRTLLRTVRREWGKMDKYRVDKFYTLLRYVLHEVYRYMAARHWNLGIIRLFNDAIHDEILSQTPNGLRYHFIDITLDELVSVATNTKDAAIPLTEATLIDCLEPYLALAQTGSGDNTVQRRVMEKCLERFLDAYSVVSDTAVALRGEQTQQLTKDKKSAALKAVDATAEAISPPNCILEQVHVGTVGKFIFQLASDPATGDAYRKALYDLHKRYMRRIQQVGYDVDLEANDGDEDEGDTEDEYSESDNENNMEENANDSNDGVDVQVEQEKHSIDASSKKARNLKGKPSQPKKEETKAKHAQSMLADQMRKTEIDFNGSGDAKSGSQQKDNKKDVDQELDSPNAPRGPRKNSSPTTATAVPKDDEKVKRNEVSSAGDLNVSARSAKEVAVTIESAVTIRGKKKKNKKREKRNQGAGDKPTAAGKEDPVKVGLVDQKTSAGKEPTNQEKFKQGRIDDSSDNNPWSKKNQAPRRPNEQLQNNFAKISTGRRPERANNEDAAQRKKSKPADAKEEVVTISLQEQRKAKAAGETGYPGRSNSKMDDPGNKKRRLGSDGEDPSSLKKGVSGSETQQLKDRKRVKFGTHSIARSWTVSMQNLRTMDLRIAAQPKPEKGILLTRGRKAVTKTAAVQGRQTNNNKKKRRSAVDYF